MKRYSFIIFACFICSLTSCLKDKNIENRKYGTEGIGEIPLVEFPYNSNRTTIRLNAIPGDTTVRLLRVRLNEAQPATKDVQVTLALNNALVTGAGFVVAPASTYTVDNLVVTIPAGSREGYLTATIRPASLATAVHGIGFSITAISDSKYTISSNFMDMVVTLPVRNKYEGDYTSNGYFYHPASPRHITNRAKSMTTSGPNSVIVELANLGADGYRAEITVNETTNELNIQAAPGAPAAPYTMFTTGLPTTNPGYTAAWPGSGEPTNRYDPVTNTFYVRYGYMGATGWRVTEEHIRRN